MQLSIVFCLAAAVSAAVIDPRYVVAGEEVSPDKLIGRHHAGKNAKATSAAAAGAAAASATPAVAVSNATSGKTLVLEDVTNPTPGNPCLTFRNNGEMVEAACVNTSADRQVTQTTINGASALKVVRTFTAGFRPDLTGNVEACVGFNGTDYLAEPCSSTTLVTFTGGQLKAGTSCASGHDGAAQLTVDTTGKTCTTYSSTSVTAATS